MNAEPMSEPEGPPTEPPAAGIHFGETVSIRISVVNERGATLDMFGMSARTRGLALAGMKEDVETRLREAQDALVFGQARVEALTRLRAHIESETANA